MFRLIEVPSLSTEMRVQDSGFNLITYTSIKMIQLYSFSLAHEWAAKYICSRENRCHCSRMIQRTWWRRNSPYVQLHPCARNVWTLGISKLAQSSLDNLGRRTGVIQSSTSLSFYTPKQDTWFKTVSRECVLTLYIQWIASRTKGSLYLRRSSRALQLHIEST